MYTITMTFPNGDTVYGKNYDQQWEVEEAVSQAQSIADLNDFDLRYGYEKVVGGTYVKKVETLDTGGNIMIDKVTMASGVILTISGDLVLAFRNEKDYQKHFDEGFDNVILADMVII